jgi:hypothetical protein
MKVIARKVIACSGIVAALLLAAWSPASARMPPQIFCWTPDHEFPVGCDEEEGEDELSRLPPIPAVGETRAPGNANMAAPLS